MKSGDSSSQGSVVPGEAGAEKEEVHDPSDDHKTRTFTDVHVVYQEQVLPPADFRQPGAARPISTTPPLRQGGSSSSAAGRKFEQFAVVTGHSNHRFANELRITKSSSGKKPADTGPSPEWSRRIQQEWRSLEKDLPEGGIFVRVYEERMDLLSAAIVGPAGTPYHDGLFFFDIHFPPNYPNVPMKVRYVSKTRFKYSYARPEYLSPNLTKKGEVCLSLLDTWSMTGRRSERWMPGKSTTLQLLVSLQAFVFNSQPYFNEPSLIPFGRRRLPWNKELSLFYNETVFLQSLRTMSDVFTDPPMHFQSLVRSHLRSRGRAILLACKAYTDGVVIGSDDPSCKMKDFCGTWSSSDHFKLKLRRWFDDLLRTFQAIGVNCEGISLPALTAAEEKIYHRF